MADGPGGGQDLVDAVAGGEAARVAALLDEAPDRVRERSASGRSLLSVAVRAGHLPVLQLLLDRGADPTWAEVDAPRGAALYEAARAGRRDMVEALLGHGADPNTHVVASGNAVFAAARRDPGLRALLEAHGGTLDPYDLVWLDEDDEVLQRVRADPASAHAGCGGVYTAVVTRGKRDLLRRLLDAGVRVPPAPCGCRSYLLEDVGMLRELLARGGLDGCYADETGATLLHDLCRRGVDDLAATRVQIAELLLGAGADARAPDVHGVTPLDLARRADLTDLVALFERADR